MDVGCWVCAYRFYWLELAWYSESFLSAKQHKCEGGELKQAELEHRAVQERRYIVYVFAAEGW